MEIQVLKELRNFTAKKSERGGFEFIDFDSYYDKDKSYRLVSKKVE